MTDTISMDALVKKLEELKAQMDAGNLKTGEYDQQLARVIGELRDRKVEGDRATMTRALDEALRKGTITPSVKAHMENRLGLV